jgi:hypothetical protein
MPTILIDPADLEDVRSYLGVTTKDLSNPEIQSTGFLESAEAFITQRLNAQPGLGVSVPTVAQIITTPPTSPAVAADLTFLKSAVIYRVAYLFANSEVNAVDTSITIGPLTKDLGGIGAQWKDQREEFLKDCDQALGGITGFKRWRTL